MELAQSVLESVSGPMEEIRLYPDGPEGLNAEKLCLRDALLSKGDYNDPMFRFAKQFAAADVIVIAAPYWDLSFPTKIRAYLEEITVSGITFRYDSDGIPKGLCRAERLIYVTTAGGKIIQNFGFEYVKSLSHSFYGISDVVQIKAEGLDIRGANPAEILEKAKCSISTILST